MYHLRCPRDMSRYFESPDQATAHLAKLYQSTFTLATDGPRTTVVAKDVTIGTITQEEIETYAAFRKRMGAH